MSEMIKNHLWDEYREYVDKYPLSGYERRLLRGWVKDGHSVYETVESAYLPGPAWPPMDFIDAHRLDRELREGMKGMKPAEREKYLKDYIGFVDETPNNETVEEKLIRARSHIDELEHQLFFLWQYLGSEGMWTDAEEYLEEHRDDEIPFGWD